MEALLIVSHVQRSPVALDLARLDAANADLVEGAATRSIGRVDDAPVHVADLAHGIGRVVCRDVRRRGGLDRAVSVDERIRRRVVVGGDKQRPGPIQEVRRGSTRKLLDEQDVHAILIISLLQGHEPAARAVLVVQRNVVDVVAVVLKLRD